MWAYLTDGMEPKQIAQLEWELDEAYAHDRRAAPDAPVVVPDTPGENLGTLMRMMSTGVA